MYLTDEMIRGLQILIIELCFVSAWACARLGVSLLPREHPLRTYHAYSEENIKPVYRSAGQRIW